MIARTLNRVFGEPEEINGHERCPTYLYRWSIIKKRRSGFAVYLHHFVGDDWSRDLHDHPKRFISIGLKGAYLETSGSTVDGEPLRYRWYRAPWIRTFRAEYRHRIQTPSQGCWTLVIVGRISREWGFWHRGVCYPWHSYVSGENSGLADSMKACD